MAGHRDPRTPDRSGARAARPQRAAQRDGGAPRGHPVRLHHPRLLAALLLDRPDAQSVGGRRLSRLHAPTDELLPAPARRRGVAARDAVHSVHAGQPAAETARAGRGGRPDRHQSGGCEDVARSAGGTRGDDRCHHSESGGRGGDPGRGGAVRAAGPPAVCALRREAGRQQGRLRPVAGNRRSQRCRWWWRAMVPRVRRWRRARGRPAGMSGSSAGWSGRSCFGGCVTPRC